MNPGAYNYWELSVDFRRKDIAMTLAEAGTNQRPLWSEFLSIHSDWVKDRLAESDELYFVPKIVGSVAFRVAFGASDNEVAAEQAIAEVCRRCQIVGVRVLDVGKIEQSARFI